MKLKPSGIFLSIILLVAGVPGGAQGRGGARDPQVVERRESIEKELESLAIVERKVMVPMRDGKRMAADIYRPKDASKKYPIIFSRTPYNFNYWDVRTGTYRDMSAVLEAVKRGYAYVEMNERGPLFLRGQLRHSRPPAQRRRRRI